MTEFASYNGHKVGCLCVSCCMADMDAHCVKMGWKAPAVIEREVELSVERTRYRAPGTACGTGTVRKASAAQVAFIKRLMTERDMTNLTRLPGGEDVDNISLRGARDLIERLLACPLRPSTPTIRPASDKQIAFCLSLIERKGVDTVTEDDVRNAGAEAVSKMIEIMIDMPDKAIEVAVPRPELTEGMYTKGGRVFKVQRSRTSGRLYAKRLIDTSWEYEAGAIRTLTAEDKMTLEEAKAYGRETGVCCVCGRELTNEASIEAGIGPICASKF